MSVAISREFDIPLSEVPLLTENRSIPMLQAVVPFAAPYVDNANIVGLCRTSVDRALRAIMQELDSRGLLYHEVVYANTLFT